MAERLADAVSPYLRAHAGNPVDWYPWGERAFAEAKARDVPVLISIGYATCHWCHVMARESFSDPAIAATLAEGFVAIKVDREEHPDVDGAYLAAASAFTRQLGWPLTVFADPDGRAFYAGTYFPPQPVQGMPAFRDVLAAVSEAWRDRRTELEQTASAVAEAVAEASVPAPAVALPGRDALDEAAAQLAAGEDPRYGGIGGAPKFPVAPVLSFLARLGGDRAALARRTLLRMGASPLRDPVDGGFFRYATRADWSEPHYERMLSDNALLLDVAVDLLISGGDAGNPDGPATPGTPGSSADDSRLAALARDLIRFLSTTMRLPSGGFASAQDSESIIDGVRDEGGYYSRDADGRVGLAPPALDEKVLTGWNGLAIGALARAGALLGDVAAVALARDTADWLLARHVGADGRLLRASRDGRPSTASAALEDSGMLAQGLLRVALATGEPAYAAAARRLVDATLHGDPPEFAAPGGADPVLAARGLALPADPAEGAAPSGPTTIADAARLLHALGAGDGYLEAARRATSRVAALALPRPIAFGGALRLMADLDAPLVQVVTVVTDAGDASDRDASDRDASDRDEASDTGEASARVRALADATRRQAASVAVVVTEAQARGFAEAGFDLFEARVAGPTGASAYRCEHFTCALPVHDAEALKELAG
ncbi:thioredoxin domain-containing protein [Agromyces sp. MMS24-K17]|uniref:thioredoxin domain-containing protein n=1 Tax=Agromyces sp. MMS24-K17 TaxID=3372850 RepID=UPI0037547E8C